MNSKTCNTVNEVKSMQDDARVRIPPAIGGFNIIELIGVLAIVAIIAAAMIPTVIRRLDQATWTKETADLEAIASSYTQYILRSKTIPGPNTWASATASEMSLPVTSIATNSRGYARAFLVDPNLNIGGAGLPYTQTTNGTTIMPTNARVMFVSSLSRALPSGSLDFNDIWSTPENVKPSTWTSWGGSGADLRIKKLTLEPLFHQLILINHDTSASGRFSIDGVTPALAVPSGGMGWSRYYLDGTVLGLHDTNSLVQTRYLMTRSISFVFESDMWLGQLLSGQNGDALADDFAREAAEFFNSSWNSGVNQGASQFSVLVAMYTFMYVYTLWATQCPNFDRHDATGSNPTSVPEYDLLNMIGQNNGGLDKYSDDNTGLLK